MKTHVLFGNLILATYFFLLGTNVMLSVPKLTVFIHGTVGLAIQSINLKEILSDTLAPHHKGFQLGIKFRNHPLCEQDQIMVPCGFFEIPSEKIQNYRMGSISQEDAPRALYHIIGAYDDLAQRYWPDRNRKYAVFGWTGLLSARYRVQAAEELYHALVAYRDACRIQEGCDPEITLIGHSHGGTVALYLAQAEKKFQNNLQISYVCMLGTPIHQEIVSCIEDQLFKNIIVIYSEGDFIQPHDTFSTREHKSYRKMADVINLVDLTQKKSVSRTDILVQVHDDHRRIDHMNMWFLEKSTQITNAFGVFPFVIAVPALVHGHSFDPIQHAMRACIHECINKTCNIEISALRNNKFTQLFTQHHLEAIFGAAQARVEALWIPFEHSRHILINKKNIQILKNIMA